MSLEFGASALVELEMGVTFSLFEIQIVVTHESLETRFNIGF
jgi:hypothetical protein